MAATELQSTGRRVMVLDKGRGVGGRMATRRIGEAVFDHGAQFFTSAEREFADRVHRWEDAGVVRRWFDQRLEPDGTRRDDGHPRWCGVGGMTAVAKHLAKDLDVRTGVVLTAVSVVDGEWRGIDVDGVGYRARAAVITPPAPQTLALLDAGAVPLHRADRELLDSARYHPCVAVMIGIEGDSGIAEPGAERPGGEPLEWFADNRRKGISPVGAVTIHAGPETSAALWDATDDEIVSELGSALAERTGRPVSGPSQVMRWRYARPVEPLPGDAHRLRDLPPAVLAGDLFAGSRVPGAARSGLAAARML